MVPRAGGGQASLMPHSPTKPIAYWCQAAVCRRQSGQVQRREQHCQPAAVEERAPCHRIRKAYGVPGVGAEATETRPSLRVAALQRLGHAISKAGVDFGGFGLGSSKCEHDAGSVGPVLGNRDVLSALRLYRAEMGSKKGVEACDRAEPA